MRENIKVRLQRQEFVPVIHLRGDLLGKGEVRKDPDVEEIRGRKISRFCCNYPEISGQEKDVKRKGRRP